MKISATYKGLLTGMVMIAAAAILFYGLKFSEKGYNQFLVLAIYVIGLLWSLISLKLSSANHKGFKQYFAEGFKTFIVVTLLMVIYSFIFYKLNPQIMEEGILTNETIARAEGKHTPAEITDNSIKLKGIFMPMMIAISTMKYMLVGIFVTLLGAVTLSRK